jgi:tetratricopeptide (TPR) repeat protein
MNHFLTRTTIPQNLVIVFGIFFAASCASLGGSGNSGETQITSSSESISVRLDRVNDMLAEDPADEDLQSEKADLLFSLAQNTDNPSQRQPIYRNLRDISEGNRQASGTTNDRVENVINRAWNTEQGSGVELLESSRNNEPFEAGVTSQIQSHFENAIILRPDSLTTYNLLANTFYLTGDLSNAIETLRNALEAAGSEDPSIRERLAYLYLESGDIEQSILIYRDLADSYPNENHIRHGLANALILNNQHDEAISILRNLVNQYSARFEYREALAVQLYYQLRNLANEWIDSRSEDELLNADELSEIESLAQEIDTLLSGLQDNVPLTEEQLYRSSLIFRNGADRLYELSTLTDEESVEVLESLQIEFLQNAIPHLEKLAENHPENREYIRTLYNVYLDLGMQEEADEIERSNNL